MQGLGLSKAVIELDQPVFIHGQPYVANLSRIKFLKLVMVVELTKSTFHKNDCSVQQKYEHLAELSTV